MIKPPEVKNPCPMLWGEMHGDVRTRFCDHCKLHVQNLSAMSQRDVARVLARIETEHVCVTYTRRGDGSMVTRWDSVVESVLAPMRRGFAWLLAASVPIIFSACQTQSHVLGAPCKTLPEKKTAQESERVIVTGGI
jgi:hypothetical protein